MHDATDGVLPAAVMAAGPRRPASALAVAATPPGVEAPPVAALPLAEALPDVDVAVLAVAATPPGVAPAMATTLRGRVVPGEGS